MGGGDARAESWVGRREALRRDGFEHPEGQPSQAPYRTCFPGPLKTGEAVIQKRTLAASVTSFSCLG